MKIDSATIALVLAQVLDLVLGERDKVLYCGACLGMVDDMNWWVSNTDPKQKVQIGGFRLDAPKKKEIKQIPLARSEAHLIELLENTCNDMRLYAKKLDNKGNSNFFRVNSREGKQVSLKDTDVGEDMQSSLKFACETIIEEYEEQLIKFFQEEEDNMEEKLCIDMAGYCVSSNVTEKMMAYGSAIMAGMAGDFGSPSGMFGIPDDWSYNQEQQPDPEEWIPTPDQDSDQWSELKIPEENEQHSFTDDGRGEEL